MSAAAGIYGAGCQTAARPGTAEGYFQAGRLAREKGDYSAALDDFSRAINLAPRSENAFLARGLAYADKGDLPRAIADFTAAIELSPDDGFAYSRRGIAHEDNGDLAAALEDYTVASQLEPNVLHLVERGDVRRYLGDVDGAMADYSRAIDLDPKDDLGYLMRGLLESYQGDAARAQADYTHAIELNPTDGGNYRSRANFWVRSGRPAEALQDFEAAQRLSDGDHLFDAIQIHLLHKRLGMPADDRRLAAALRGKKADWPQPVVFFLLGRLSEARLLEIARQGDAKTVRDHLCDSYYYIGTVRLLTGDRAAARRFYAQCVELDHPHSVEWHFAQVELARLDGGTGATAGAP